MSAETTSVLLVAAAALHLGFQATVTALVYPALSRVPAERFAAEHLRHSRAIVPVVMATYGALLAAGVLALVVAPSGWVVVAALGAAVSCGVTAAYAAPLHGRLGSAYHPRLVDRLLRVDRLRLLGALVCLAGALGNVLHSVT